MVLLVAQLHYQHPKNLVGFITYKNCLFHSVVVALEKYNRGAWCSQAKSSLTLPALPSVFPSVLPVISFKLRASPVLAGLLAVI